MNYNLLNLFKNINVNNLINGTNKTLTIIKKSIPVYKEIRPYINHEKRLFKKDEQIKESKTVSHNNTYNDSLTFFN